MKKGCLVCALTDNALKMSKDKEIGPEAAISGSLCTVVYAMGQEMKGTIDSLCETCLTRVNGHIQRTNAITDTTAVS